MSASADRAFPSQLDVLVVGAGAAGLYAALCLPERLRVGLITKDTLKVGSSQWAQGGIAAAIDPQDSPILHIEDTLAAGVGLCDRTAVEFLAQNASEAIAALVDIGVAFDRHDGKLAMTLEAAHSRARVLHSKDTTGRAIVDRLAAKVLERPNIQVLSAAFALSLWIDPINHRCQGIRLLEGDRVRWISASAVILATGGGGQVFAKTTNPAVSTGDGVALAWRAGAIVRDLEFFQFHPTALSEPGAPHFLISEAVRGEGAHLVDEEGRRFAFDYHPAGELAPRDVVSRAIFNHLQKTAPNPATARVYLDLRPIASERIDRRFPNIIQKCKNWGIDVFKFPIPVAPAAHYWMGGIAVDRTNLTSIPGLYAIGETASTGVHGANRLASNSLLECIVFAGELRHLKLDAIAPDIPDEWVTVPLESWDDSLAEIETIRQSLPALMWKSAGICRNRELLEAAISQVKIWRDLLFSQNIGQYILHEFASPNIYFNSGEAHNQFKIAAETLNLLDISDLILKSAVFRQESRGGHYRTDYPQTNPKWQVHTLIKGDRLRTSPIHGL